MRSGGVGASLFRVINAFCFFGDHSGIILTFAPSITARRPAWRGGGKRPLVLSVL